MVLKGLSLRGQRLDSFEARSYLVSGLKGERSRLVIFDDVFEEKLDQ